MVISFASRILNGCERIYHVTEKELLSVVFACNKFRTYILGYTITVRSDHRSISFLKQCKLSHGRLTRWILLLQEYHINWEYIPGKRNTAADVLSRINIQQQTFEGEKEQLVKVYNIIKNRMDLENITQEIRKCQNVDPKIRSIRERLLKEEENIVQYYNVHNNLLFIKNNPNNRQWKLVIPSTVEEQLILDYHIRLSLIHIFTSRRKNYLVLCSPATNSGLTF